MSTLILNPTYTAQLTTGEVLAIGTPAQAQDNTPIFIEDADFFQAVVDAGFVMEDSQESLDTNWSIVNSWDIEAKKAFIQLAVSKMSEENLKETFDRLWFLNIKNG